MLDNAFIPLYSFTMHPLDSARLKIQRAKKHIAGLNLSIRRASHDPKVTLVRKGKLNIPDSVGDPTGMPDIYALSIDPAIGLTWGQITGDVLNNLRASLDHIAWALAIQRCKELGGNLKDNEAKRVSFPIRLRKAHTPYRAGVGLFQSDINFFPDKTWDVIDSLQPYNRKHKPKTELLGILKELVDKDKHRIVTPVSREVAYSLTGDKQFSSARLYQPYELLFLVDASTHDKLKPETTFDIILDVTYIFPRVFSISRLGEIHDFIRDEVIPAFTSYF